MLLLSIVAKNTPRNVPIRPKFMNKEIGYVSKQKKAEPNHERWAPP